MGYYVGRRGSLGIAREATRGTATAPAYWVPYNSITFDDKVVQIDQDSAFGRIEDADASYVVKKYGEGEFEYDLEDKALGVILAGVAGAAPTTTGSTNYSHAFAISNTNNHQSLSLLVQDPNVGKMFRLSMVDKFTIKVEPEGLVKATVGFRSAAGQDWASVAPVYTALGNKFIHTMMQFKIAANIAGIGAATPINLNSLEFTIEKNLEDFQDLGTATPSDIFNKQLSVSGNFEIGFADNTYRNYMLDGSYKAIQILFTYGANNSLTIQLPRVRFANWEPSKGLDDIASEKIEFKGLYDAANATASISTLTLANQVASY